MTKTIFIICSSFPTQFKTAINGFSNDENVQIVGICTSYNVTDIKSTHNIRLLNNIPLSETQFDKNAIEWGSAMTSLKNIHIIPDIILVHVGFGIEKCCNVVFPNVPIIGYFEWLFTAENVNGNVVTNIFKNINILDFVPKCSLLVTPTNFQRNQFPGDVKKRMMVIHEGVDINYFKPLPVSSIKRREKGEISGESSGESVSRLCVTYVSRGLEPMRCFMQFIHIIKLVLMKNDNIMVKIIGEDVVVYDDNPGNVSYKTEALCVLDNFKDRVHFMGKVDRNVVLETFQMSDLHVYFTEPFVPSWSFLEAMSCECLVITSDNGTMNEFIGINGLKTNHNDYQSSANLIINVLKDVDKYESVRKNARKIVSEKYNVHKNENVWKSIVSSLM